MNLFQWLTVPLLSLLFLWDFLGWFRSLHLWNVRLLRCLVWLAGALAIADPVRVTLLARALGIDNGLNLVLYVLALVFVVTAFYFYSRNLRLERQLTEVIRHLAIQEARRGQEKA